MDIITVGAIVRSFAGMLLTDTMSTRKKQAMILALSIILFVGYTVTHGAFTLSSVFDSLLSGLTAGLTAIGIYHSTQTATDTQVLG